MSITQPRAWRSRKAAYDCLGKKEPDEPIFVLLARDSAGPSAIKVWATLWLQEISLGLRPKADRDQVTEALKIATDMEIWRRDRHQKAQHAAMKFDGEGRPISGEHARSDG